MSLTEPLPAPRQFTVHPNERGIRLGDQMVTLPPEEWKKLEAKLTSGPARIESDRPLRLVAWYGAWGMVERKSRVPGNDLVDTERFLDPEVCRPFVDAFTDECLRQEEARIAREQREAAEQRAAMELANKKDEQQRKAGEGA